MLRRRRRSARVVFLPLLFILLLLSGPAGRVQAAFSPHPGFSRPLSSSLQEDLRIRGVPPASTQRPETAEEAAVRKRARLAADHYLLSNKVLFGHILARHGADATVPGKSRFLRGYDVRAGIDYVLKSPDARIQENTEGRRGYLFEFSYRTPIGISPEKKKLRTMRVVIDAQGRVITAFPVK
ncbi:MAG: hypothetical protein HY282_07730 [Nitrospirae bacterium]|nr:hypothetical protein [Candidatus Manganitrophaceae bacterium]